MRIWIQNTAVIATNSLPIFWRTLAAGVDGEEEKDGINYEAEEIPWSPGEKVSCHRCHQTFDSKLYEVGCFTKYFNNSFHGVVLRFKT